uniref:Uncharacterized protein n=1 Tax=Arundo donax TaxID=35708 RepID=A0A0A9HCE8_ARUDO
MYSDKQINFDISCLAILSARWQIIMVK